MGRLQCDQPSNVNAESGCALHVDAAPIDMQAESGRKPNWDASRIGMHAFVLCYACGARVSCNKRPGAGGGVMHGPIHTSTNTCLLRKGSVVALRLACGFHASLQHKGSSRPDGLKETWGVVRYTLGTAS
jgi:hypothetical protein